MNRKLEVAALLVSMAFVASVLFMPATPIEAMTINIPQRAMDPLLDAQVEDRINYLVPEMMRWLDKHGVASKQPREVLRVPRAWIQQMTKSKAAAGSCSDGVIYLDEEMEFKSMPQRSVLLHELVHIAQATNCTGPYTDEYRVESEYQAYKMQADWYKEATYGRELQVPTRAELIVRYVRD